MSDQSREQRLGVDYYETYILQSCQSAFFISPNIAPSLPFISICGRVADQKKRVFLLPEEGKPTQCFNTSQPDGELSVLRSQGVGFV
jgi:hypothetical protein